ncbi:MAG: endonuclease III domain-containing protein [Thermodesulfobacteriota bacterium]
MPKSFKDEDISTVIEILKERSKNWDVPIVTLTAISSKDPFKVLISTILSLRTKDETTAEASRRLFEKADTPRKILKLSEKELQKLIYPVGFYRVKAKNILDICSILIKNYKSQVPDNLDELLKFNGVGRKTANLVVSLGFGKPAICVDIHVHRISNRLGYLKTKNPFETEMKLREKLPRKYWIDYNSVLVAFGQKICRPVSPICSECAVENYCCKVGVIKSR